MYPCFGTVKYERSWSSKLAFWEGVGTAVGGSVGDKTGVNVGATDGIFVGKAACFLIEIWGV